MAKFSERWDDANDTFIDDRQASNDPQAHALFGGKTLKGIGKALDLDEGAVTFGYSDGKDGEEIKHLCVTIDNVRWLVPFSRGADANNLHSLTGCSKWLFRSGFMSVKNADGTQMKDPETGAVVTDETKPYLTFGLPMGINITRTENPWLDEPTEDEKFPIGGAAGKEELPPVTTVRSTVPLTAAQKQAAKMKAIREKEAK